MRFVHEYRNNSDLDKNRRHESLIKDEIISGYYMRKYDDIEFNSTNKKKCRNESDNNIMQSVSSGGPVKSEIQCIDDVPLWYIMSRYREVHDLWHVLFDIPTDLIGNVSSSVLTLSLTSYYKLKFHCFLFIIIIAIIITI